MAGSPTFHSLEFGIWKMPAADPEVHLAAKELVRDSEAYFERRRESDLQEARQILRQRTEKMAEELAAQDRQRRRERLRRLFGWLLPRA